MSIKIGAVKMANIAKDPGKYDNFTGWIMVTSLTKMVVDASFVITAECEVKFKEN